MVGVKAGWTGLRSWWTDAGSKRVRLMNARRVERVGVSRGMLVVGCNSDGVDDGEEEDAAGEEEKVAFQLLSADWATCLSTSFVARHHAPIIDSTWCVSPTSRRKYTIWDLREAHWRSWEWTWVARRRMRLDGLRIMDGK